MTAVRTLAAALVAVALLGTGGCAEPEARSEPGSGADAWATSVCRALSPWRTRITDLTAQAQQQMGSAKTPEQAKANLVALLTGAEQSSEDARRKIVDAGVPPVQDGQKIADRFTASLAKARDAYGQARKSVSALPTGEPKRFYDGVIAAFNKLGDEYAASAIDTRDIGSTELQRAFDESAECG